MAIVCLAGAGLAATQTNGEFPLPAVLVVAAAGFLALSWGFAARRQPPPVLNLESSPEPQPAHEAGDDVVRFVKEISDAPSVDRLQEVISRTLPALLEADHVWVVARFGEDQHVILPRREASKAHTTTPLIFGADKAEWATYPLIAKGEMVGVLGVDITARRMSSRASRVATTVAPILAQVLHTSHTMERLREASMVDSLTGCSTRKDGLHRLRVELKRAERNGRPLAVLMIDLDHFKSVNDRFGHNTGDRVLEAVGRTMMQTLRASDIRCRWGGEEFLVVLPESAIEQARRVAAALLRRIAEMRIAAGSASVQVTASIGVSIGRPGEHDIEALIGRADRALYRAKEEGRACVRFVLGDLAGQPIGNAPLSNTLPFPERRDPRRSDRRRVPGPGRRSTDAPVSSYGGPASSDPDANSPEAAVRTSPVGSARARSLPTAR